MFYMVSNNTSLNIKIELGGDFYKITTNNHFDLVRELLNLCDEAFFVSPFLCSEFDALFAGLELKNTSIELITTCAPRGTDQLTKPFSILNFGNLSQMLTGLWPTIGIDQSLHSKIYIFIVKGTPFAGVVTSANLTKRGLSKNHETGILLFEEALLIELIAVTRTSLDYVNLTEYQIKQLCTAAELVSEKLVPSKDHEIGLKNILNNYCTPSEGNRNVQIKNSAEYYIKVSGVSDRPILPEQKRVFDKPHTELSFAKMPNNIRLGDCLLEVAVGGMCFLSCYSCASAPFERSENEKRSDPDHNRWPYFIFANNLSLHYGKNWFKEPLYYDNLISEFKSMNPSVSVTKAGKDHIMGAIQSGNSYIRVTKEFGKFVKQKIDSFEY